MIDFYKDGEGLLWVILNNERIGWINQGDWEFAPDSLVSSYLNSSALRAIADKCDELARS